MTIAEALQLMEEMRPGAAIAPERMKKWLSSLDRKIFEELIQRRMPDKDTPAVFCGYNEATDENTVLLVPEPDAEEVYQFYLSAKIDLANQEMEDYINSASLFNTAYDDFAKKYARCHRQKVSYNPFYN